MNEVEEKLENCNTLNEIFDVLDEYYDLDQQIGPISKVILVKNVGRIIKITGAKRRTYQIEP